MRQCRQIENQYKVPIRDWFEFEDEILHPTNFVVLNRSVADNKTLLSWRVQTTGSTIHFGGFYRSDIQNTGDKKEENR